MLRSMHPPKSMFKTLRKTLAVALGFCFVSASQPTVALDRPITPGKPNQPQQYSLPNGLRIILLEDHSLPVVSSMVWYKVGARNEQPGLTGLSHIVEHLLFQTVGQYRKGELGATIVRNGGQFNGFTSDDFTSFYETMPPAKIDLALKIESERMKAATFSQADLNEEIARVKTELDESAKDPSNNLAREVRSAAFIQHPYRNPAEGWRQDLDSLTAKDAKEFYERYFRPNNATLVLVGDFKSQPTLISIGKLFGTIAKGVGAASNVRISEGPQVAERRVVVRAQSKKDEVQIAYHAPAFSDPDSVAMYVLEKLLNAPMSGRIKTKLLDSKLCGFGKSAFEIKKEPGLFTIDLTAPPGAGPQKVLEAWDLVASQLRTTPVSDSELVRARNQAEFAVISERDGAYKAGFQLGYCETMQSWLKGWTSVDRIRAVNSADILRVCKRYLNPDARVVGFLVSQGAKPATAPTGQPQQKNAPPTKAPPNAANPANPLPKMPISTTFGGTAKWGYKEDSKSLVWPAASQERQELLLAQSTGGESSGTPAKVTPTSTSSGGASTSTRPAAIKSIEVKPTTPVEKAPPPAALVQKKVLKNGVTVLLIESHLAPIIQISGAIRAGDVFEPANKKGISSLLVQLLNDGPAKLSRHEIQQQQEDIGLTQSSMLKFDNSIETINLQSRCLSKDVFRQMQLIGSCLKGLSFEEADCEKAKSDFFASAKSTEDTTPVRVNRALLRSVMAPGSSYYPSDPKEKVHAANALKAADLKDFASQHLTPDSTVIVVAGDITPDLAFMQIERALDGWSNAASRHGTLPQATENARKILKVSLPDSDIKGKTLLTVGRLMPSQSEKKDYADLLIADCALSNHPIFSRLAQRLTTDPSLENNLVFEDMESRYVPLSNMVSWSMTVPVDPRLVQKTSLAIQTELKRFAKSGITAEELAEVKRYLASSLPVRMMPSCTEAAKHVLTEYLQDSESNIPWQLISRIRSSDLTTINNFIKNEFKPDQSILIVAGQGAGSVPTAKPVPSTSTEDDGSESGADKTENSSTQ